MNRGQYYKLFSCCIITHGASRSLVCDLQRKLFCFIPNSLAALFDNKYQAFNLTEIETETDEESKKVLKEYIIFLAEKELVYRFDDEEELKHFPALSTEWLFPAHISNCVIDITHNFDVINYAFLTQLEALCCNYIQLRFFEAVELSSIQKILNILNPTQIKAIELVIQYFHGENDFEKDVLKFIDDNRKVRNITISGGNHTSILKKEEYLSGSVFITKARVENTLHCGVVQMEQFSMNIPHYTESLHHNTCLNRKIAIDAKGNIKNCPSMKESFGNIRDTTLEEAINKPGFKKYWNIKKDDITKCKDCEFRHVCTDCRAYIDNPEDIYSAPLKCGYDPYTCTWEEWSTNPLKQKAIDYYGMREMVNSE